MTEKNQKKQNRPKPTTPSNRSKQNMSKNLRESGRSRIQTCQTTLYPRHPLKSSKHQCPSPHSQPASVCSRINMHNQQCLIHLSYEHSEVKNQHEQADRLDVGMGGFRCIVSIISIPVVPHKAVAEVSRKGKL